MKKTIPAAKVIGGLQSIPRHKVLSRIRLIVLSSL